MTQLLTHTIAHSTKPSFSPQNNNQPTKAKSNYRGSAENPAHQKFYIHFFIDNSNVNFILYNLSCPKLKSGQLKVFKMMFALESSIKK